MFLNKKSENKQQYYKWLKVNSLEPIIMTFIDKEILFEDDRSRLKTLSSLESLFANQEDGEEKYQKARELYNVFIDYLKDNVPLLADRSIDHEDEVLDDNSTGRDN